MGTPDGMGYIALFAMTIVPLLSLIVGILFKKTYKLLSQILCIWGCISLMPIFIVILLAFIYKITE